MMGIYCVIYIADRYGYTQKNTSGEEGYYESE
jgi:hypothetical protein